MLAGLSLAVADDAELDAPVAALEALPLADEAALEPTDDALELFELPPQAVR